MDLIDNPVETYPSNIRDAILSQSDFYIQFALCTREVESQLMKMLRVFLSRYDILYLRDVIVAIIKELITNAVKANAKRLYFKNKNLSIDNPDEYILGMRSFKHDVLFENSELRSTSPMSQQLAPAQFTPSQFTPQTSQQL